MAQTTSHETEMDRASVASYLRSIADEIDGEGGVAQIPIGNKSVSVSPGKSIDVDASVVERSRRLRKDSEELSLVLSWHPSGATDEAGES